MLKRTAIVIAITAALLAIAPGCARANASHGVQMTWGAIGDSITYGIGSSDHTTMSYPAQAGLPYEGRPGQGLVVSGWWAPLTQTFPSDLAQLAATDGVNGVIVEIGINDLSFGISDRQYKNGYRMIEQEAAEQGVAVELSTITPFGPERTGVTPAMQAQRLRINTWLRKQANHIDFAATLGGDTLAAADDSGDGLHPGDAGYTAMAQVAARWTSLHSFRYVSRPPTGPLPRR